MKLKTIALASAFALSSTFALAQAGGANGSGATLPENSGTATNAQGGVVGTTTNGVTTGSAANRPSGRDASTQGAPTAVSAGKMGNGASPGGTMAK